MYRFRFIDRKTKYTELNGNMLQGRETKSGYCSFVEKNFNMILMISKNSLNSISMTETDRGFQFIIFENYRLLLNVLIL